MVRILTVIAVTLGVGFFLFGMASGRSLWVNLVFMMGIIVANVPEGLLPTFTLALAMGSLRMARKNVLVKSLNAVEALGAAAGHLHRQDRHPDPQPAGGHPPGAACRRKRPAPRRTGAATCWPWRCAPRNCFRPTRACTAIRSTSPSPAAMPRRAATSARSPPGTIRHFPFDADKRRAGGIGSGRRPPAVRRQGRLGSLAADADRRQRHPRRGGDRPCRRWRGPACAWSRWPCDRLAGPRAESNDPASPRAGSDPGRLSRHRRSGPPRGTRRPWPSVMPPGLPS